MNTPFNIPCSLHVQFQLSVANNPNNKHSPLQLSFNMVLKSNVLQRNLKQCFTKLHTTNKCTNCMSFIL